jgi:predicted nucleic acid-binding protein
MEIVLDSSVALAWVLPDETSSRADRLLAKASRESVFWVPALWWYEVANALTAAQRRRRLTEADRARAIELYGTLPVRTDAALDAHALWRFQVLAEEHGLSAYDAAYMELAQRKGLRFATFDGRLATAARRAGIRTVALKR